MPFNLRSIVAFTLLIYVFYITMELIELKIKKEIQSGNHSARHWFLTGLSFVGGIASGWFITRTPAWSFFQQRLLGFPREGGQADYAMYLGIEGDNKVRTGKRQRKLNQSTLSASQGVKHAEKMKDGQMNLTPYYTCDYTCVTCDTYQTLRRTANFQSMDTMELSYLEPPESSTPSVQSLARQLDRI
ncbi:hypothetical protein B0J17DRAFT_729154 [Rhizoctonia solani]|nr:hypothetical protein B0J17DRAFT_729154 [Rhizoctonia solani]